MASVQAQDEEAKEFARKYDVIRAYYEIGIARIQFIYDYFKKFSGMCRQTMSSLSQTKEKKGKNGAAEILSFVDYGSQFNRVPEAFAKENEQMAEFLDQGVLKFLQQLLAKLNSDLDVSKKAVDSAEKARLTACDKLSQITKSGEETFDKLAKAYTHMQQGQDKKAEKKISDWCAKYRLAIVASLQATDDLNEAHQKYAETVAAQIEFLCQSEKDKADKMMKVFEMFQPGFEKLSAVFDIAKSLFKRPKLAWEFEFKRYVRAAKLERGNLPTLKFTPHKFSFDDERLKVPPPEPQIECTDAPVLTGRAVKSFRAGGDYEMSVEEGELLFLYELPKYEWCYAENFSGARCGYVPSKILEPAKMELAVVVASNMPSDSRGLIAAVGEIVVVETREPQGAICRNRQGEQGFLPSICLLYRSGDIV